ncbi:hypothetical protein NBRC116602_16370 [Hyphomicrobiales bacterium 4NK60-0047b]
MVRVIKTVLGGCLLVNLAACCLPPANGAYQSTYQKKGHNQYAGNQKQVKKEATKPKTTYRKKALHQSKLKKTSPMKQAALEDGPQKLENKSELPPLKSALAEREKKREDNKAKGPTLKLLRSVDNLQHPQSISFDKKRLRFYVSQLGEKAQPSTGSIALLARDGSVINKEWIKGLNQPRGMAMMGGMLYVADGKSLLKIDVEAAKIIKKFEQPTSFYLYDVSASDQGEIYVSDPLSNSILKLESDETLRVWLKDKKLEGPNSLAIKGNSLYVSSIGLKASTSQKGPGNSNSGKINQVELTTKQISSLTNQNNLKKIASLGIDEEETIYATSLGAPKLMRFSLKNGELLENIDVQKSFDLKETQGLADFLYFPQSKEFWVPVKNNGHLLVFVRSDATLLSEGNE